MRVVFMGTPDFSVPTLEALIKNHEVVGVVTQPDKKKGRGKTLSFPPVKEKALEYNIPVYQPQKVREEAFVEVLRQLEPEVIVVAAFGQILPETILNLPKYGCINVHASLLPKYRGAAPIQWAIIEGEKETGITIMYMEKGLDTGDMIDRVIVPIAPKETGESLHDKLASAGAPLLLRVLSSLEEGTAVRTPQKDEDSSYAKMLTKDLGKIHWEDSACKIERLIRGLNSWPSAYTTYQGKTLKIWDAEVAENAGTQQPGTVVRVTSDAVYVQTGDGVLQINAMQIPGKKKMSADAFLRGHQIETGTVLG